MSKLKVLALAAVMVVSAPLIQGCSRGAIYNLQALGFHELFEAGTSLAIGKAGEMYVQAQGVEGIKSDLKACEHPSEVLWDCRSSNGIGEMYLIFKRSDNSIVDRKEARKYIAQIKENLRTDRVAHATPLQSTSSFYDVYAAYRLYVREDPRSAMRN